MTPQLLGRERRVSTRRFVVAVLGAVAVLRLTFLVGPLLSDEAGYLLVARSWRLSGPNLYGHYFVDRPPALLGLFRVAALVPWDHAARALAIPFALTMVAAAAWAAHQLVGGQGARWAAVAAGAFVVTPVLGAEEANGEVFAAPLVMLSVALAIAAVRHRGGGAFRLAVAAGVCAALAVMVKQSFGDAVVFAVVLVVASVAQHRLTRREGLRVALGGVAGGAVVLAAAWAYVAATPVGLSAATYSLVGFRESALAAIAGSELSPTAGRAGALVGYALLSGVLPVVVLLVREAWRWRFTGAPVAWAVTATLLFEAVAIFLGGSFWPHYLIQSAPMLALAVGLWGPQLPWLRLAAAAAAGSAVVATGVHLAQNLARPVGDNEQTGRWLAASSRPGDTLVMLYGHAEVNEAAGLRSPYPYLWSLPLRTLDPHLTHLRALLAGPRRPDWVVVWTQLDSWDIDPGGRTRLELATHYRLLRHVCGHQVWLADDEHRSPAPLPRC